MGEEMEVYGNLTDDEVGLVLEIGNAMLYQIALDLPTEAYAEHSENGLTVRYLVQWSEYVGEVVARVETPVDDEDRMVWNIAKYLALRWLHQLDSEITGRAPCS